jgi:putative component of membrane protein insertase Oxa1/YidC/SpoIIIJ protein YidD
MKKILIKFIEFYRKSIAPWLLDRGVQCKYEPTCSEYTKQAIEKYGALKRIPFRNKAYFKV